MNTVIGLLDRVKTARGITSDNGLAHELGVTRQAVSKWRNGQAAPDPVTCAVLAQWLNLPLARVLGIVGEQRAISESEKRVWRQLASAAVIVLGLLQPTAPVNATESGQVIHYAHLSKRHRRKCEQSHKTLASRFADYISALLTWSNGNAHAAPLLP